MPKNFLEIDNVTFAASEKNKVNNVSLSIENEGDIICLLGPSGSGNTTLLGICAGLDSTSSGTVELCGVNLGDLNEDEKAILRSQKVGFIFQDFQLLPSLTALENILVPLELQGHKDIEKIGLELLEKVNLGDRKNHYPSQLSGGEQQRVAIARAFANKPTILFADEPTGNLDEESGENAINLLLELNKESGTTLVIVTHDLELAKRTQRMVVLKGGKIQTDISTI